MGHYKFNAPKYAGMCGLFMVINLHVDSLGSLPIWALAIAYGCFSLISWEWIENEKK